MNSILARLNEFFGRLPDRLRRRRLLVWCASILIVLILGSGIGRLRVEMSMDSFFAKNDPTRLRYDLFKDAFGSDEEVYVVYEAMDGDIFSQVSLEAVKALQEELLAASGNPSGAASSPLGHITEVRTIVNADYLEVKGDTLVSREFADPFPATDAERERLRGEALAHRDYPLSYLSQDTRYGGIFLRTDFGTIPVESGPDPSSEEFTFEEESLDKPKQGEAGEPVRFKTTTIPEYAEFTHALDSVIAKPEYGQALRFYPVGNAILMGFINNVIFVELEWLLLAAMGIMLAVLYILFRSLSAVLWPITIVILTSIVTLGLMGWVGVTMSTMLSVLLLLILVVGIADSVHILSGYLFFRRKGLEHRAALGEVFRKSGLACLLTSVTTAAGMLALLLVPIAPIRDFGIAAATGVMLAFLFTVVLLPPMLDLWRPASHRRDGKIAPSHLRLSLVQGFLNKLEPLSHRYPLQIVLAFLIVAGAAVYGIGQVHVDSNIVQMIRARVPLHQAFLLVDRVMGGSQNLEIFLDFGRQDALQDPRALNAMAEMQVYLEGEQGAFVVKTSSLVNAVKNSFQALNEDRPEMYRIPQERAALAQTLLLFDSADPEDRQLLVSDDYSQGRISVRMLNFGSMEYLEFFQQVRERVERVFDPLRETYPKLDISLTGNLALIMQMADYISYSQIRSFAMVLAVVTVLLLILFGSVKAGLVAMVPNALPIIVTFGAMGLLGIPVDVDTLIIAPIVIGIAVDDTIHFLTHYRAAYLESGEVIASIRETLSEAGQAITFTSLILILGFLVLVVSNHQGMANFGILTAVAFGTALLADLLLLPALCVLFRIRFEK